MSGVVLELIEVEPTVLSLEEGITELIEIVTEGPQGIAGPVGPMGSVVIVSEDEPIGQAMGAIWFAPTGRLLSVFDGTDWIAQRIDVSETFTQSVPASTWTVQHGLSKFPSVTVYDSANDVVIGDIRYNSNDQLTITFSAPFSGSAVLN